MHTRIPDAPSDWPSLARIHTLFCVASAVESPTDTRRRLRQLLEIPGDVRLTPRRLMETMSWEEYWLIVLDYSERLTQGARTRRMDADT